VTLRSQVTAGLAIVGIILALSFIVPALSPHPPDRLVAIPNQAPSWSHPFGTDTLGRDVFVRTFAAGRTDLLVAAVGVGFSLALGALVGVATGLTRFRFADSAVMRLVDAIIAVPFVILVLALVVVIGTDREFLFLPAGLPALLVAILLANWTIYARLTRAETLAVREREYIVAANLLGYSRVRLVRRHVLPVVIKPAAAYAASDAILIMVLMASLAFLGAGVQPPAPEWGNIMYEGRTVLSTAWWISVAPGAVLAITGLGLALIADGLNDSRRRGRG
jgi:peptide/nickel transport system permease protein